MGEKKGLSTGGPEILATPPDVVTCLKNSTNLGTKYSLSWESSEKRKSQKCNGKEERKEMGSQIAGP